MNNMNIMNSSDNLSPETMGKVLYNSYLYHRAFLDWEKLDVLDRLHWQRAAQAQALYDYIDKEVGKDH